MLTRLVVNNLSRLENLGSNEMINIKRFVLHIYTLA